MSPSPRAGRAQVRAPLAALLVVVASCGDDPTAPVRATPRATVRVDVDSVELTYLGERRSLTAVVSVPDGAPTPGAPAWASTRTGIVRVAQDGALLARTAGVATVYAMIDGGGYDSVKVVVRQRPVRVVVEPGRRSRPMQRTFRFAAVALDAGGARVPDASFTWSTPDPSHASVDGMGLATAVAVGTARIRASVVGMPDVMGDGELVISPLPALRAEPETLVVGVGQVLTGWTSPPRIVADSLDAEEQAVVTVASADPDIATAGATVHAPVLSSSNEGLVVRGVRAGVTSLRLTAPRFAQGTVPVRVTTPRLTMYAQGIAPLGEDTVWLSASGRGNFVFLQQEDSAGTPHASVEPVTVTVTSLDPAIARTTSATMTLPADAGLTIGLVAGTPGATRIVFSAPGYLSDTINVRSRDARASFVGAWGDLRQQVIIGAGQQLGSGVLFVAADAYAPGSVREATIAQKHPDIVRLPRTTLPLVEYDGRATVDLIGLAPGVDTLVVSAAGNAPDTVEVRVTTPTFRVEPLPAIASVMNGSLLSVHVADSLGGAHYPWPAAKRVRVTSSNPSAVRPMTELFDIGASSGGGGTQLQHVGLGTATLTLSDPDMRSRPVTTTAITVVPTGMIVGYGTTRDRELGIGMHQRLAAPDSMFAFVYNFVSMRPWIRLRSTDPTVARPLVDSAQVQNSTGATARWLVRGGERTGRAWIVMEGTGLAPDSIAVVTNRPTMEVRDADWILPTDPWRPDVPEGGSRRIVVRIADEFGAARVADEPLVLQVTSSDSTVLAPAVGTVTIPTGERTSAVIVVRARRAGSAIIRFTDPRTEAWSYGSEVSNLFRVYESAASP